MDSVSEEPYSIVKSYQFLKIKIKLSFPSIFFPVLCMPKGFPGGSEVKASASNAGDPGSDPWVGKIPWRRKWQSTPVFLPGESHGRRSLVGHSPRGRKKSDTTERLHVTSR